MKRTEMFFKPFSLVTMTTLMNNTSYNQGDHCIVPFPLPTASPLVPTIAAGNQVAVQGVCTQLMQALGQKGGLLANANNAVNNVLELLG